MADRWKQVDFARLSLSLLLNPLTTHLPIANRNNDCIKIIWNLVKKSPDWDAKNLLANMLRQICVNSTDRHAKVIQRHDQSTNMPPTPKYSHWTRSMCTG
mmetsp:Transcript_29748/g.63185  ORF Transcript_29748/g.63185 Transcript_29748/m.63185 type:complete len:100 (+) Transcript_29748:663-962(+)